MGHRQYCQHNDHKNEGSHKKRLSIIIDSDQSVSQNVALASYAMTAIKIKHWILLPGHFQYKKKSHFFFAGDDVTLVSKKNYREDSLLFTKATPYDLRLF